MIVKLAVITPKKHSTLTLILNWILNFIRNWIVAELKAFKKQKLKSESEHPTQSNNMELKNMELKGSISTAFDNV